MGRFDKLRRATDGDPLDPWDGDDDAAAAIIDLRPPDPLFAVTEEVPLPTPRPGTRRSLHRYDPTQPGQTPVSGVDLVTFAVLSRRLQERPPHAHANLLAGYGHTPSSWSAINTVWMARMGHQPFLYDVYEDAFRRGG